MKYLAQEIFWIAAIAVIIALVFNFASTKSIPIIPKTIEEQTVSTDELLSGLEDEEPSHQLEEKTENSLSENEQNISVSGEDSQAAPVEAEQKQTIELSPDKVDVKEIEKKNNKEAKPGSLALNKAGSGKGSNSAKDVFEESSQENGFSEIRFVNYEQVKQLVGKKGVQFIDARAEDFFNEGRIGNAINCHPWKDGMPFIDVEKLMKLPKDKTYIVYCTGGTCTDSHEIAEKMLQLGFKKVFVYHEGYDEWEQLENT